MALREYARFVEDAALCRRVERAKTRVRELSALMSSPRDVSARVGVGESRIQSIVKKTLRVARWYRHASAVDLVVRVTILVNQTRGRALAPRSGWTVRQTAQPDGPAAGAMTDVER
jgi:hypothetical protein